MKYQALYRIFATLFVFLCTVPVFAQGTVPGAAAEQPNAWDKLWPLFVVETLLLVIILVGGPWYSKRAGNGSGANRLRGLNLPNGSIRSMMALLIVGSFVNFLIFGAPLIQDTATSTNIITAFGTLSGSVIGFYFGSRTSAPPPP